METDELEGKFQRSNERRFRLGKTHNIYAIRF